MKEINYISVHKEESLQDVASEMGEKYDSVVLMYLHERILYRLSISDYRESFSLKGDHFLYALRKTTKKVIKRIDLLASHISNDTQSIKTAFEKICTVACVADGVDFDADGVDFDADGMIVEKCNQGISIKIPATFKERKKTVQLVISFGEVIVPKPQNIQYPVLLDMKAPVIRAYSKESMVAEKFEEILSSSTAKDSLEPFYDVHVLLETQDFDGRILLEAVFETFQRRGTIIEKEQPLFTKAFVEDKERTEQWRNLRSHFGHEENLEFGQVKQQISNFLTPIYKAILEENEYFKTWNSQTQTWK